MSVNPCRSLFVRFNESFAIYWIINLCEKFCHITSVYARFDRIQHKLIETIVMTTKEKDVNDKVSIR